MLHWALNKRLLLGLTAVVVVGLFGLGQIGDRLLSAGAANARIEIWHGTQQRVGHLGNGQADFNLMGRVQDPQKLLALQYTLNDSIPVELNFRAYRRLAMDGHFNADIPIAALAPGRNTIEVQGRFADGSVGRQTVTLERLSGASPLPVHIDWSGVSDPQDVGQYVDGHWRVGEDGLRPEHLGYDRLFLIGDETWQDYQITAVVKIHEVTPETGPLSGGNGLGRRPALHRTRDRRPAPLPDRSAEVGLPAVRRDRLAALEARRCRRRRIPTIPPRRLQGHGQPWQGRGPLGRDLRPEGALPDIAGR